MNLTYIIYIRIYVDIYDKIGYSIGYCSLCCPMITYTYLCITYDLLTNVRDTIGYI
jgi:hypothetical protein